MSKSLGFKQEIPATVAPALNVKAVYDIPLVADLREILINLSGTVAIGTAVATSLKRDGICELIKSVDLIANGSITIASLPFHQIVQGNMFRRRKINAPTLTQPGLTVATQPFAATGVLDLAQYGALRPKDSSVRETDYKTLQLQLTFAADFSGVFVLGSAVIGASSIAVIVKANSQVELPDATGKISSPILRPQYSYREDTVSALTTRQRFRLTPEQALRGITLRVVDSTGNATSDVPLSKVRVYTGNTLRLDLSAAGIRADNNDAFTATIPTGYYYLDFADQGGSPDRLNDCYDLRAAVLAGADAYLEYDTSAALTLGVTQWGLLRLAA